MSVRTINEGSRIRRLCLTFADSLEHHSPERVKGLTLGYVPQNLPYASSRNTGLFATPAECFRAGLVVG
jgi:hypothetical protein